MLGVVFAAGAMGMSVYTGSHIPDALGSIAIGGLLGGVATFMIVTNTNSLVGKSIPEEKINSINEELEGETKLPGGQINNPSSGKYYTLLFLPATPWSPSQTLEGLFELARRPSRVLDSSCVVSETTRTQSGVAH